MNTEIVTISGMHCPACEKLVRMELEEAGFGSNIKDLIIQGEEGKLTVEVDSFEELVAIKNCINNMESYEVKE